LANHLWRHNVLDPFFVKLFSKFTLTISVNVDLSFLQTVFKDLLPYLREEVNYVCKFNNMVLLQESNNICFCPCFDEVLEESGLRVVHLQFRLNLANCVKTVKFTYHNTLFLVFT